ncbi:hypothetical protein [Streptomyces sp. NPDC046887]|uniref:hypothetical protein n=1 Tax=Streptomyces sp. NPDC046887 TaxID=3155472 RepID=UPI0033C4284C
MQTGGDSARPFSDSVYADCDIYADHEDGDLVRACIRRAGDFQEEGRLLVGLAVSVRVAHNDYRTGRRDDFLEYGTVLECTSREEAAPSEVVESLRSILRALSDAGVPATPSCYFEEELLC